MTFTDEYYKEQKLKLKLQNLLDTSNYNNYIKTQIQYLINRQPELQSCIPINLDDETDIIETLDLFGTFENDVRALNNFIEYICNGTYRDITIYKIHINLGYNLMKFNIDYFSLLDICYLISEDILNIFNKEQKYNLYDLTPLLSLEEINSFKSKINISDCNSNIQRKWRIILVLKDVISNSKVKTILKYLADLYYKTYLP